MAEQQIERVDPQPRSVAKAFLGRVSNPSPDRVYCMANPNEDMFGVAACENDGWKPLIWGKCNEKIVGARRETGGERVMVQGQVVMWRPKAEHDAYLAEKSAFARQQLAAPNRNETIVIDGDGKQS